MIGANGLGCDFVFECVKSELSCDAFLCLKVGERNFFKLYFSKYSCSI